MQSNNRLCRRHAARAFSMLELTFVIVIIGVIMSVAVFAFGAQTTKAKAGATKASMNVIKQALVSYNAQENGYPPTLAGLIPSYLERSNPLRDGWKREFYYDPTPLDAERPFQLRSFGADGISSTTDDIDVWTMNN